MMSPAEETNKHSLLPYFTPTIFLVLLVAAAASYHHFITISYYTPYHLSL
jgi:hypothetical protein